MNNAEFAAGSGGSAQDPAYICHSNPISARLEGNLQYIHPQADGLKVFWMKSHLRYGQFDYPPGLDCFAAFRAPAHTAAQMLRVEVVEGELVDDSYLAFANDFGDTEVFTDPLDPALPRELEVQVGMEQRRRFVLHFHSGSAAARGFLVKFSVTDL